MHEPLASRSSTPRRSRPNRCVESYQLRTRACVLWCQCLKGCFNLYCHHVVVSPQGSSVDHNSNATAACVGACACSQGQCTAATSAVAADHLVHLLKDRAAVIAAEAPGNACVGTRAESSLCVSQSPSLHAPSFLQLRCGMALPMVCAASVQQCV